MEQMDNLKEIEKKAKKKTKSFLLIGLVLWMGFLFFFLNQSRNEHSLVFAQIIPTGWDPIPPVPVIFRKDTTNIDPNVDPNVVVIDSTDIDTSKNNGNSYSLRKFAPSVGDQGQLGSCVSWATAYAGFTIVRRVEENNPTLEPYSPLNLYVRYKKHFKEDVCGYGACTPFALNILKRKGCSLFKNFRNSCKTDVDEEKVYNDKLYSYDQISPSDLTSLKTSISSKRPIVISIPCYENCWHNAVFQNGIWSGYYSGALKSGHAMCVIGYDDKKGGGAFEVMNSWGEDWGDNGFFWITYADFTKHVNDCYALIGKKNK